MNYLINNLFSHIKSNVRGELSCISLIHIESGVTYDTYTKNKNIDATLASSYCLQLYKAKVKQLQKLNINQDVTEITTILSNHLFLINITPDKEFLLIMVLDKENLNLGLTKHKIVQLLADFKLAA